MASKALITGASTGIGAVYADRLAGRGHDLILVARDRARLERLAERLESQYLVATKILAVDLLQPDGLAQVEAEIESERELAVVVNNAGMAGNEAFLSPSTATMDSIIGLNVRAATHIAAAATRALTARRRGQTINIASVVALIPERFEPVYVASKAFLLSISQSMAPVCAEAGVHVQVVLPGAVRTEIWERAGSSVDALPTGMVMDVDDLVDAALKGLDMGELVTIPSVQDLGPWERLNQARQDIAPFLSLRKPAARYL